MPPCLSTGRADRSTQAVRPAAEAFREGSPGKAWSMDPAELLRYAVERRASDVHLKAGNVPFIRVDGELLPAPFPIVSAAETRAAADTLMPSHKADEFARTKEADFAYTLEGVGRFRVNVLRESDTVGLAIRWVSPEDLTFEQLHLPEAIRSLAETQRGLVLVTGPTGAGKTTTIATILGFINRTRRAHIVTIEDPIEVVFNETISRIVEMFPPAQQGQVRTSVAGALRGVVSQRLLSAPTGWVACRPSR